MPTSSQALILQHSSRGVPPMFGRRLWKPDLSYRYYAPSMRMPRQLTGSNKKSFFLRRSESAPNLRLDFSSLPDLLQIHGMHGQVTYDKTGNPVSWGVPINEHNMGAVRGGWNLAPILKAFTLEEVKRRSEISCVPKFRKTVQFPDTIDTENKSKKSVSFMKMDVGDDGRNTLTESESNTNCFFRLIKNKMCLGDEEMPTPCSNTKNSFRLVGAFPSETGVFRLAKLDQSEEGDYKMIPPLGYESDDFRLVETDPGFYKLLQEDPNITGRFREVQVNETDSDFKLVQAEICENTYDNSGVEYTADIQPKEIRGQNIRYDSYHSLQRSVFTYQSKNNDWRERNVHISTVTENTEAQKTDNHLILEDRYHFFDDVIPGGMTRTKQRDLSLPDIGLFDSKRHGLVQSTMKSGEMQKQMLKELEINSSDNGMDEFRAKYGMAIYDDKYKVDDKKDEFQPQAEKYVSKFRKDSFDNTVVTDQESTKEAVMVKENIIALPVVSHYDKDSRKKTEANGDGVQTTFELQNVQQGVLDKRKRRDTSHRSTEWRTDYFEEWSRSTDVLPQPVKPSQNRRKSLIDEVKLTANYKQWKKNKIANVRLRKDVPESDLKAVCLKMKDNVVSHQTLKDIVENETGVKLASLQFDPVSVHSQDSDAKSQWILRFYDEAVCRNLITTGIKIEGVQYSVRSFNDVTKEEHEAYKLNLLMMQIRGKKSQKPANEQKQRRQTKAIQTQTTLLSVM